MLKRMSGKGTETAMVVWMPYGMTRDVRLHPKEEQSEPQGSQGSLQMSEKRMRRRAPGRGMSVDTRPRQPERRRPYWLSDQPGELAGNHHRN